MRWVLNVWCISNKKIGLESQNKRNSCRSINMRLPVSFHVHQKLVFACETKISHLSYVCVCGCVCMLVSVLSHLFCYLSCAGTIDVHLFRRNIAQPNRHSHAPNRIMCVLLLVFLLLLLSFQSDNWAKRARTNDFLRNFKFNHILTIQSPDCLNVYNCTLDLHVSQFFSGSISISNWIVLDSAIGMHVFNISMGDGRSNLHWQCHCHSVSQFL